MEMAPPMTVAVSTIFYITLQYKILMELWFTLNIPTYLNKHEQGAYIIRYNYIWGGYSVISNASRRNSRFSLSVRAS